ncbi:hypothetical protein HDU96_007281 [Phlyctochytrium bullatum]|nr:hypothetical protein HDU96_007281 [Phlyctochytrium bullatum]
MGSSSDFGEFDDDDGGYYDREGIPATEPNAMAGTSAISEDEQVPHRDDDDDSQSFRDFSEPVDDPSQRPRPSQPPPSSSPMFFATQAPSSPELGTIEEEDAELPDPAPEELPPTTDPAPTAKRKRGGRGANDAVSASAPASLPRREGLRPRATTPQASGTAGPTVSDTEGVGHHTSPVDVVTGLSPSPEEDPEEDSEEARDESPAFAPRLLLLGSGQEDAEMEDAEAGISRLEIGDEVEEGEQEKPEEASGVAVGEGDGDEVENGVNDNDVAPPDDVGDGSHPVDDDAAQHASLHVLPHTEQLQSDRHLRPARMPKLGKGSLYVDEEDEADDAEDAVRDRRRSPIRRQQRDVDDDDLVLVGHGEDAGRRDPVGNMSLPVLGKTSMYVDEEDEEEVQAEEEEGVSAAGMGATVPTAYATAPSDEQSGTGGSVEDVEDSLAQSDSPVPLNFESLVEANAQKRAAAAGNEGLVWGSEEPDQFEDAPEDPPVMEAEEDEPREGTRVEEPGGEDGIEEVEEEGPEEGLDKTKETEALNEVEEGMEEAEVDEVEPAAVPLGRAETPSVASGAKEKPSAEDAVSHAMKSRMVINVNKGVEGGRSLEEVQRITFEASKNSRFGENERQKAIKLLEAQKELRARRLALSKADIEKSRKVVKEKLAEMERERDLSRTIVHVDMDAFYCAVEELDRPDLKDKPMAVGGRSHGVLCTANYVARKMGVRSAMATHIALKLCENLVLIPPNFDKYQAVSDKVMGILQEYDPNMHPASLDEAYLDLTNYLARTGRTADDVVHEMRERIVVATGCTASAGIGANKMLAKVCSDRNKPNGQFRLPSEREAILEFWRELKIRKVSGIGPSSEATLKAFEIEKCGDIEPQLPYLHALVAPSLFETCIRAATAVFSNKVERPREMPESKGRERTFSNISSVYEMMTKLREIAFQLAKDLEASNLHGRTFELKVKHSDFTRLSRSKTLAKDIGSFEELVEAGEELLMKLKADVPKLEIRLLGLSVSNLKRRNETRQGLKELWEKNSKKDIDKVKEASPEVSKVTVVEEEEIIEVNCPICGKVIVGGVEKDLTPHINMCLKRQREEKASGKRKANAIVKDERIIPTQGPSKKSRLTNHLAPTGSKILDLLQASAKKPSNSPITTTTNVTTENDDMEYEYEETYVCPACHEFTTPQTTPMLKHLEPCLVQMVVALKQDAAVAAKAENPEDAVLTPCPACGVNQDDEERLFGHLEECLTRAVRVLPDFDPRAEASTREAAETTLKRIMAAYRAACARPLPVPRKLPWKTGNTTESASLRRPLTAVTPPRMKEVTEVPDSQETPKVPPIRKTPSGTKSPFIVVYTKSDEEDEEREEEEKPAAAAVDVAGKGKERTKEPRNEPRPAPKKVSSSRGHGSPTPSSRNGSVSGATRRTREAPPPSRQKKAEPDTVEFPMEITCPLCMFRVVVESEEEIERHVAGCLLKSQTDERKGSKGTTSKAAVKDRGKKKPTPRARPSTSQPGGRGRQLALNFSPVTANKRAGVAPPRPSPPQQRREAEPAVRTLEREDRQPSPPLAFEAISDPVSPVNPEVEDGGKAAEGEKLPDADQVEEEPELPIATELHKLSAPQSSDDEIAQEPDADAEEDTVDARTVGQGSGNGQNESAQQPDDRVEPERTPPPPPAADTGVVSDSLNGDEELGGLLMSGGKKRSFEELVAEAEEVIEDFDEGEGEEDRERPLKKTRQNNEEDADGEGDGDGDGVSPAEPAESLVARPDFVGDVDDEPSPPPLRNTRRSFIDVRSGEVGAEDVKDGPSGNGEERRADGEEEEEDGGSTSEEASTDNADGEVPARQDQWEDMLPIGPGPLQQEAPEFPAIITCPICQCDLRLLFPEASTSAEMERLGGEHVGACMADFPTPMPAVETTPPPEMDSSAPPEMDMEVEGDGEEPPTLASFDWAQYYTQDPNL